jgi:hypothetical protein
MIHLQDMRAHMALLLWLHGKAQGEAHACRIHSVVVDAGATTHATGSGLQQLLQVNHYCHCSCDYCYGPFSTPSASCSVIACTLLLEALACTTMVRGKHACACSAVQASSALHAASLGLRMQLK